MTKRTPDLSGQIQCNDATEIRTWGQSYRGIRILDGAPVQIKGIGPSKSNSIEVLSTFSLALPVVDLYLAFLHRAAHLVVTSTLKHPSVSRYCDDFRQYSVNGGGVDRSRKRTSLRAELTH